eukprot:TRINITY_DN4539_c0_g3_i1.p1 TRINITY_DN4539_c0_g3~~TRINITY_DN4539_c0_g3_i1.p1  ORF type:complete len:175 (+),score=5.21 TRINITY_DN4539_c0_g3_i1:42-566(+)
MVVEANSLQNALNITRHKFEEQCMKIKTALSKPLTRDNVLFHYTPIAGCMSYSFLSMEVIRPSLVSKMYARLNLSNDISTSLFLMSVTGVSIEIYKRKLFSNLPEATKICNSVYYSTIFTLGSVLGWAFLSRNIPDNTALKTGIALYVSISMLHYGHNTLNAIDDKGGHKLGSD